jgi:hypothetical protein
MMPMMVATMNATCHLNALLVAASLSASDCSRTWRMGPRSFVAEAMSARYVLVSCGAGLHCLVLTGDEGLDFLQRRGLCDVGGGAGRDLFEPRIGADGALEVGLDEGLGLTDRDGWGDVGDQGLAEGHVVLGGAANDPAGRLLGLVAHAPLTPRIW